MTSGNTQIQKVDCDFYLSLGTISLIMSSLKNPQKRLQFTSITQSSPRTPTPPQSPTCFSG